MTDNKNLILAIVISTLIIIGWQFFYVGPMTEKQRKQEQAQQQTQQQVQPQVQQPGQTPPAVQPQTAAPAGVKARAEVIAATPRVRIDTPALEGSINLKGAQFDDLHLKHYRETVQPSSPIITLLSPSGTPDAYFAEQGVSVRPGDNIRVPGPDTQWSAPQGAVLTATTPVTLSWDNGQGLVFTRTISVDSNYLFTIQQEVENRSQAPVTLFPYARAQRQGEPHIQGYWLSFEGMIGVLEGSLQEINYSKVKKDQVPITVASVGGWLGFTDKYWGVALIPHQLAKIDGTFTYEFNGRDIFQSQYLARDGLTVPAGGKASYEDRLFAGAKVVQIVNQYQAEYGIDRFDLMIDWGWFYFLTKPMFWLLEFVRSLVGNFGVAILVITVIVKLILFPLANKSYAAMSKMKKLQPEMERIRKLYPDDKMKQQQELMEVYKKEKVSPLSGCLPMLIQAPIMFALYKVLFTTIEMRHAPFFGWIQDLSAPDPTTIFNLFGLIPWSPPHFLLIGIWPLIMGVTMWVQMRLNPTPPDPIQASLFNWMPVMFTFMLAQFPAGLVIYWAWQNILSIAQQWFIMRRNGVEVDLFGNIRESLPFLRKKGAG